MQLTRLIDVWRWLLQVAVVGSYTVYKYNFQWPPAAFGYIIPSLLNTQEDADRLQMRHPAVFRSFVQTTATINETCPV